MFTVTLPYDIGALVKIPDSLCGTIEGYCVFDPDKITVVVSGYKEAWCGEYLLSEIEPMEKLR